MKGFDGNIGDFLKALGEAAKGKGTIIQVESGHGPNCACGEDFEDKKFVANIKEHPELSKLNDEANQWKKSMRERVDMMEARYRKEKERIVEETNAHHKAWWAEFEAVLEKSGLAPGFKNGDNLEIDAGVLFWSRRKK